MSKERVIIAGAGPVGLGAALELARFGVPSVVLEKHSSPSTHPKTRTFNTRTMEIARGWGPLVYQRLRGIDTPPGWKSPLRFVESLIGKEFGQIQTSGFKGPGPRISPAMPVLSSQDLVEAILRDAVAATELVELRFGHEVTEVISGAGSNDDRVTVRVRASRAGSDSLLEGAALVGADGVDSVVRAQLGIALVGEQGVHHFVNCYFSADIEPLLVGRSGVLYSVANEAAVGMLQPLDARGRWLCQISVPREQWDRELWSCQRVQQWVRAAVGVADLDVDVHGVGLWRMNVTVAEQFVRGRVVLCGDAAHQFPPTGGLGVNTGLQGMHNAMWKLALCVQGPASWSLLDTYDTERHAPAADSAQQSYENFRNLGRIRAAHYGLRDHSLTTESVITQSRRYGNHLGVEFGTVYRSAAVIPDGHTPPIVDDEYTDYLPSATPGCRAPHVRLGQNGLVSTLDLFGPGFTVLTGIQGDAWRTAAAIASRQLEVAVAAYQIGSPGLIDIDGNFLDTYQIGADGAVLVRPDGYVAWRHPVAATHDDAPLTTALENILRPPTGARL
jgi:putative polyketide hydroxylase